MMALCASALGCLSYLALWASRTRGPSAHPRFAYAVGAGLLFAASTWAFSEIERALGAVLLAALAWTATGSLLPLAALRDLSLTVAEPSPKQQSSARVGRGRSVARALVSILGTLPPAWLAAAALARLLPLEASVGLSVGFVLALPFWVLAMCLALLDQRVWRAGLASAVVTAATYGVLHALG
jgi:hypothetical protein